MKIVALTPLHIGSGETHKALSYVTDRQYLYVVNMGRFFASLSESQRTVYLNWMDPILARLSDIDKEMERYRDDWEKKRKLQHTRKETEEQLSLGWFIENRLRRKAADVAASCQDYRVSYSSQPGRDGVRAFIKNPESRPYIPGSEIKGAIRTALLSYLLEDPNNYRVLEESLQSFRTFFLSGASPLQKARALSTLADAQTEHGLERKLLRGRDKDAKYDVLKFVQVCDSDSGSSESLHISTMRVTGTSRNIRVWVETLRPKTALTFQLTVRQEGFLRELGLERFESILSVPSILKACHHCSNTVLEEEERYFGEEPRVLSLIRDLKRQNVPEAPLLRIGGGQGFLGITIALAVKKRNPALYDEAIREGVSFQRRWRTQPKRFPKTRRVEMGRDGNAVSLFGWAKLIDSKS